MPSLTHLQPIMYAAAQEVSLDPWLPRVEKVFGPDPVQKFDNVCVPIVPRHVWSSLTDPGPNVGHVDVPITHCNKVTFELTGQQQDSLGGNTEVHWVRQMMVVGMRTLRRAIGDDHDGEAVLVVRPPFIPQSPILTQMVISDSRGLTYLLTSTYSFVGRMTWELHLSYGFGGVGKCVEMISKFDFIMHG